MITKHNSYYGVTKTRTNASWNTEYYHEVIQHAIWYCANCKQYITDPKLAQTHDHHTQTTTATATAHSATEYSGKD